MKSLLFSILVFFSAFFCQVLAFGSSNSLSLPLVYCGGDSNSILVIDPSTRKIVKTLTVESVGDIMSMISVLARKDSSDDFKRYVYCATNADEVVVIEATTGEIIGRPIPVGAGPSALTAGIIDQVYYVFCANSRSNTVTVINTQAFLEDPTTPAKAVVGQPIPVGKTPLALTWPDTGYNYVFCANNDSDTVTVIDAEAFLEDPTNPTKALVGNPISVGIAPTALTWQMSLTYNGETRSDPYVFCANEFSSTISLINAVTLETNITDDINLGISAQPTSLVSDGLLYLYFFDGDSNQVFSIDLNNVLISDIPNTPSVTAMEFVRVGNNKAYVYCTTEDDKIKIINTSGNTVRGIDVDFSTYALTTVYPISRKSVNNTSAHSALKNGKFGDS